MTHSCRHSAIECRMCRRFRAIDNREAAIARSQVRNAEYRAARDEGRLLRRAFASRSAFGVDTERAR